MTDDWRLEWVDHNKDCNKTEGGGEEDKEFSGN